MVVSPGEVVAILEQIKVYSQPDAVTALLTAEPGTLLRATVRVTKKLLCGRVMPGDSEPRTIEHEGREVGLALTTTRYAKKSIYVSPGNGVNLAYCRRLIPHLLQGHKLPEPLFWADKLSRLGARSPGGP